MSLEATLRWKNKMNFVAQSGKHIVEMDTNADHGGLDLAPTPKQLVLHAMMGCSAMDVVSMLQKMRQEIAEFKMNIHADKNKLPPVHFTQVHLTYILNGNILLEKAIKAIDSSLTKYCGVNYMISKVAKITYDLILNDQKVHSGSAAFIDPTE